MLKKDSARMLSTYDVSEELSSDVLSSSLVVVHDTSRGGEDDETERSGGEEQVDLRGRTMRLEQRSATDSRDCVHG